MNQMKASVTIDLNGNVVGQSQRFQRSVENFATSGAQKLAIMRRSVATVSNQIDRLGNRAVLAGGAAGLVFKNAFVDLASSFERANIQLEQLEGSVEGGKKAMSWISEFAYKTPLGFDEVKDAYIKLRTFGIDPTNGSLQALVDQNAKMAGSSAELNGIIIAVGQAWTKQKLQGEEAMQLMERGVPVWDLLAKATGKSVPQLQKLSEAGRLGRKEIQLLMDAIGKNAAGSAEKMAATWEGKISNLNDQWTRWKLAVMDAGTFDFLKGEIDGLLGEINRLNQNGQFNTSAKEASDNIVKGLKTAKEIGTGLWTVMKQIGTAAKFVADQVGGFENLAKALAYLYIANKAMRVGSGLVNAGAGIAQAAGSLLGGKAGKAAGALAAASATPVFVTNWPGSGIGDLVGGIGKGKLPSAGKILTPSTFKLLKNAPLGSIGALGAGAVATSAAYVGAAGLAGYGAGRLGMKAWELIGPESYNKFSDVMGRSIAKALAAVGNEEAKQALKIELELSGDGARNARVKNQTDNSDASVSGRVMGNH